jgi:uncharacterized MAPEG superfamily protein
VRPELEVLAWAGLLHVVQLGLLAVAANLQLGPAYTLGPRDTARALSGVPARLERAFRNHLEALLLFSVAVVVLTLGDRGDAFTANCAWTYLAARIAYVPAYASGVPVLRSVIWTVGFAATVVMLIAALV